MPPSIRFFDVNSTHLVFMHEHADTSIAWLKLSSLANLFVSADKILIFILNWIIAF